MQDDGIEIESNMIDSRKFMVKIDLGDQEKRKKKKHFGPSRIKQRKSR
jgi:hypothetical protein